MKTSKPTKLRSRYKIGALVCASAFLIANTVHADLIISAYEDGDDVIFNITGSLDLGTQAYDDGAVSNLTRWYFDPSDGDFYMADEQGSTIYGYSLANAIPFGTKSMSFSSISIDGDDFRLKESTIYLAGSTGGIYTFDSTASIRDTTLSAIGITNVTPLTAAFTNGTSNEQVIFAAVPEPASAMMLLFGAGVGMMIHRLRRHMQRR